MKYLFTAFTLLLIVSVIAAQDDACPVIVETALENASALCLETGRNQVCYGNVLVDAEGLEDDLPFTEPGNMVDLMDISTLTLSPLDEENNEWGIALLRLQANLPDTLPGQNVTVLAFGDVQLSDASEDDAAPMQAFYFQSGIGDSACSEAPNGILVQTPEGAAEVNLTINGVDIQLGSTAFLQATSPEDEDEGEFTISLLEGEAEVTVEDETVTVEAGMQTSVPLDEDLNAAGAPSEPEAFESGDFAGLPLDLLEREVELETGTSSGAGAITPRSGTWLYTVGKTTVEGAGCPPGLAEAMASAPATPPTTSEIDWGENFTAETLFQLNEMGIPEGVTFSQPETNLVRMTLEEEGVSTTIDYHLVSETLIEIEVKTEIEEGCTFIIPATMELQE